MFKYYKNLPKIELFIYSLYNKRMVTNDKSFLNIKDYLDLVTTREQTRAGFIAFALEKNRLSTPVVEEAKILRQLASGAKTPRELLNLEKIRLPLLTAAGLSDKSLKYLTENDRDKAIEELIKNFLEPAGDKFVEEVVYRYLLVKGDSLGGSMRNLVGAYAQQKLVRALITILRFQGFEYEVLLSNSNNWSKVSNDDADIEKYIKAFYWKNTNENRILSFNLKIPIVRNNVDICLFSSGKEEYDLKKCINSPEKTIMLGELKGGIDPAGADEHWKTANTALERIRNAFKIKGYKVKTSFIGAAIENKMAEEIFAQLNNGTLTKAANMTKQNQLVDYCSWIISL